MNELFISLSLISILEHFPDFHRFLNARSAFLSLLNSHRVSASLWEVVGTSGLEPPTSRLSGVRSNHLSYAPNVGGDEEDRTPDPLLAKQVLSQLSYTPIQFPASSKLNNTKNSELNL